MSGTPLAPLSREPYVQKTLTLDGLEVGVFRDQETGQIVVSVQSFGIHEESPDVWGSSLVPRIDLVVNDCREMLDSSGHWIREDVADLVRAARGVVVAFEDEGLGFTDAMALMWRRVALIDQGPGVGYDTRSHDLLDACKVVLDSASVLGTSVEDVAAALERFEDVES